MRTKIENKIKQILGNTNKNLYIPIDGEEETKVCCYINNGNVVIEDGGEEVSFEWIGEQLVRRNYIITYFWI